MTAPTVLHMLLPTLLPTANPLKGMSRMRTRRHLDSFPARLAALALAAGLATAARAAEPDAGLAYVSNQGGGISVIDLATMELRPEIEAFGKEPRGLGVTADGKLLVLANREGGKLTVIDRASGKLLRHIAIGPNPEFVRTRGHYAFVSFEPSSTGKAPTKPGVGPAPEPASAPGSATAGAAPAADKEDADSDPARIAVVDLASGKLLRTIKGGLQTEGIEFAADGQHILITNEEDNTVTVHRIADGKRVKVVSTKAYGERPRGVKMSPDGKHYVVTLEQGNAFIVLDAAYRVVKSVKTGASPYGVSFDRAGQRLFVASARSKTLQVFDADSFAPIKDVPTGDRCWHFSFTPDDKHILLACGRSSEVLVIDTHTLETVKRIADAQTPWGVVTYPKAMGSLDRPE